MNRLGPPPTAGARPAGEPQAGFIASAELRKPWISGFILRSGRTIPRVRTGLDLADRLGALKVRLDIGRMDYRVLPGLYAVADPDPESPVFVTANYKLSFDRLRSALEGLRAWILVLDTKGVNVWCAAGKGSFGTEELVARLASTRLGALVSHRRLVLPQLGAPGVAAPEVARRSGYRVEWGPVRASDIPAWLRAGRVKDEAMRRVRFELRDRLAVAPVELVHGWPLALAALALGLLYGAPWEAGWTGRGIAMSALLLGILPLGTLVFPALMPRLPGKAFSVKGASLGLAWSLGIGLLLGLPPLGLLAALLLATPATAFLAMNFTGSSTFTCQPGALLEVERGFWPMAASLGAGLLSGLASRLLGA